MKQTSVRLSPLTRRRIEALVGKNRLAQFIRRAIEHELELEEKARGIKRPEENTE